MMNLFENLHSYKESNELDFDKELEKISAEDNYITDAEPVKITGEDMFITFLIERCVPVKNKNSYYDKICTQTENNIKTFFKNVGYDDYIDIDYDRVSEEKIDDGELIIYLDEYRASGSKSNKPNKSIPYDNKSILS